MNQKQRNLTQRYKTGRWWKLRALDDVNLTMIQGDFRGDLMGPVRMREVDLAELYWVAG